MPDPSKPVRYKAFISYAHSDELWAKQLHRYLETYRPPRQLAHLQQLKPIFRDRDELASATSLGEHLDNALKQSAALIVICSRAARESRWVNNEVAHFLERYPERPVLCLIVSDEPPDCFPAAFNNIEPIAADARPASDGKADAFLKIAAGLFDVGFDELKQRELHRRNRRLALIASSAMLGLLITSGLAVYAFLARNEAVTQAKIANETTDFVIDVFQVADPSEARGREITAKEILDRSVTRVGPQMGPQVQSRLLFTLGKVYTGLGLYQDADKLLTDSLAIADQSGTLIALADAKSLKGKHTEAIALYRQATTALDASWSLQHAEAANGEAEAVIQAGDPEAAVRILQRVVDQNRAHLEDPHAETARALENLGAANFYLGDPSSAKGYFEQAQLAFAASLGEDHPRSVILLNNLATIFFMERDLDNALARFQAALPKYQKIFGPDHPEVATLHNNIGRIQFETGNVSAAIPNLQAAVQIFRAREHTNHPLTVYVLNTLALSLRSLGKLDGAKSAFEQAIELAGDAHSFRGPLLVEAADLYCLMGNKSQGRRLLQTAEPLMAAYAKEPWRLGTYRSVQQVCTDATPDPQVIEQALALVEAHYGANSPFTQDVHRRLAQVNARKASKTN